MKLISALLLISFVSFSSADASAWRSQLYPSDWQAGYADSEGRFLHDFSYAGYRAGEAEIPDLAGAPSFDVTQAPYGADSTGQADATAAIQLAIDDAEAAGGGVVYLPAGRYRISVPAERAHGLLIDESGVVLRGAGRDQTFLVNHTTSMREKSVIRVATRAEYYAWVWGLNEPVAITRDLLVPTTEIPVASTDGYSVGDHILIRSEATPAFIADHGMTGTWGADMHGPFVYREILAIDGATNTIETDAPTRYPLLTRDNATIGHPLLDHIEDVGIEDLSIGNIAHPGSGFDKDDYRREGTAGYDVHASFFIYFNHVKNGWVRRVGSFAASPNSNVHVLSNALRLDFSRHVTVEDVSLANPQYQGAGGNGYLFVLSGNDCLVTRSRAEGGRHNFSFAFAWANGNVIHDSTMVRGRLPADFHQRLSHANLIDNVTLERESMEAIFRDCCGHGHSASQNVFWNIEGLSYPADQFFDRFVIESQQFGHGYVIGTRGPAARVKNPSGDGTAPRDWVEGEGDGDTLEPASLWEDQRARRLGLEVEDPEPDPEPDMGPVVVSPDMGSSTDVDPTAEPDMGSNVDPTPGDEPTSETPTPGPYGERPRPRDLQTSESACSATGASDTPGILVGLLLLVGWYRRP